MQSQQTGLAEAPGRPRSLFQTPAFELLVIGLLLLFVFATGSKLAPQSDTWWHIRSGQWIAEHHNVPLTDPFTHTVPGAPWPNHEWLAEVVFFAVYQLGGLFGLACLCAMLLGAAWLLIYQLCEGPLPMRLLAMIVGMFGQYVVWTMRANMFSLLFTALCLWLIPRKRMHWLYPLVFVLWANTHAGVAFGGAILFACFVGALVGERAAAPRWMLLGLVCGLATLVNPIGLGLWQYVVGTFRDPVRTLIDEWQPPSFRSFNSYPFFILAAWWFATVVICRKSWRGMQDWALLLAGLLFFVLAARSLRHTGSFALVAVPLLTRPWRNRAMISLVMTSGRIRAAIAVAGIVAALATAQSWRALAEKPPLSQTTIAGVRSCNGPLFNSYDDGGPLMWFVPERAIFVDSRQDPFPAELLVQTRDAIYGGDYHTLFAKYTIACALVPANTPLQTALQANGWHVLARDLQHVVMSAP